MPVLVPASFGTRRAHFVRIFLAHPNNPGQNRHSIRVESGFSLAPVSRLKIIWGLTYVQEIHRPNQLQSLVLCPWAERLLDANGLVPSALFSAIRVPVKP